MEKPRIIIEYRDKKNSSGKIVEGTIRLTISSRLGLQERERHIQKLTQKLLKKINWANGYSFDNGRGMVMTDGDLQRLADTINATYYMLPLEKASFHRQNSTWGTCSLKTRQIYISHRLIGASLDLLWYVVTHEICHLAEPTHNRMFWNLVSKACPNYVDCRKSLTAYGFRINQGKSNEEGKL